MLYYAVLEPITGTQYCIVLHIECTFFSWLHMTFGHGWSRVGQRSSSSCQSNSCPPQMFYTLGPSYCIKWSVTVLDPWSCFLDHCYQPLESVSCHSSSKPARPSKVPNIRSHPILSLKMCLLKIATTSQYLGVCCPETMTMTKTITTDPISFNKCAKFYPGPVPPFFQRWYY